jgi:hypothetical protein
MVSMALSRPIDLTPIDKLGPKRQHTTEDRQCGDPVIADIYF